MHLLRKKLFLTGLLSIYCLQAMEPDPLETDDTPAVSQDITHYLRPKAKELQAIADDLRTDRNTLVKAVDEELYKIEAAYQPSAIQFSGAERWLVCDLFDDQKFDELQPFIDRSIHEPFWRPDDMALRSFLGAVLDTENIPLMERLLDQGADPNLITYGTCSQKSWNHLKKSTTSDLNALGFALEKNLATPHVQKLLKPGMFLTGSTTTSKFEPELRLLIGRRGRKSRKTHALSVMNALGKRISPETKTLILAHIQTLYAKRYDLLKHACLFAEQSPNEHALPFLISQGYFANPDHARLLKCMHDNPGQAMQKELVRYNGERKNLELIFSPDDLIIVLLALAGEDLFLPPQAAAKESPLDTLKHKLKQVFTKSQKE